MRIGDLSDVDLAEAFASRGVAIDYGAAKALVRSDLPSLAPSFKRAYGAFDVIEPAGIFDVTGTLRRRRGVRRVVRPQIDFISDAKVLFEPFPAATHLPLLEWAMNFLFAERLHAHLLLHAGVVEREGCAVILPALPGSGKSTLTAALSLRGFRLLSDEFGVVRLSDGMLLPLLKPVALKNDAIDVIERFAPDAVIGKRFEKTRKGTVAHLAPRADAVDARRLAAAPRLIVFPRYDPGVELRVEQVHRARAFGRLAVNSFNFELLGPAGFDAVDRLVRASDCYQILYRDLEAAIEALKHLLHARPAAAAPD